jgi:hypothetical protein
VKEGCYVAARCVNQASLYSELMIADRLGAPLVYDNFVNIIESTMASYLYFPSVTRITASKAVIWAQEEKRAVI